MKVCAVPKCKNSKKNRKMFVPVPSSAEIRKKWLQVIGLKKNVEEALYLCEDHFDLPNDMSNYTQYCVNGYVLKINLKPGVIPSKLDILDIKDRYPSNNTASRKVEPDLSKHMLSIKSVSHASTQTDTCLWDSTDISIIEEDPLALPQQQNCGSSTFNDDSEITLEKLNTDDEGEFSYYVVTQKINLQ